MGCLLQWQSLEQHTHTHTQTIERALRLEQGNHYATKKKKNLASIPRNLNVTSGIFKTMHIYIFKSIFIHVYFSWFFSQQMSYVFTSRFGYRPGTGASLLKTKTETQSFVCRLLSVPHFISAVNLRSAVFRWQLRGCPPPPQSSGVFWPLSVCPTLTLAHNVLQDDSCQDAVICALSVMHSWLTPYNWPVLDWPIVPLTSHGPRLEQRPTSQHVVPSPSPLRWFPPFFIENTSQ